MRLYPAGNMDGFPFAVGDVSLEQIFFVKVHYRRSVEYGHFTPGKKALILRNQLECLYETKKKSSQTDAKLRERSHFFQTYDYV
ncbi:hypothetical protein GCM10023187_11710 [Nibrella viscosa]|uniref:Uncharacterized protein n=1 Tax=Nibrella viscosa TaxID=1084524 RepID=A0ABP8K262_9BACT